MHGTDVIPLFQIGCEKLPVHEWVKNGNLDTWMTSCKPLRSQALPFVYLGTVKLRTDFLMQYGLSSACRARKAFRRIWHDLKVLIFMHFHAVLFGK
jgi:hypothetical protein